MKMPKFLPSALIFVAGLTAGAAAMVWHTTQQWQQWFMDFNVSPLLTEVTYGIKELRQGNAAKLETTLTETAWRNIGLISYRFENGLPIPANSDAAIKYHCNYNSQQSERIPTNLVAEREQICKRLLEVYTGRSPN